MNTFTGIERYVDAATIAERVFSNAVNARWVREHCPGVRLSERKMMFLESRVREWLREKEHAA